jgi:hypothetical protein
MRRPGLASFGGPSLVLALYIAAVLFWLLPIGEMHRRLTGYTILIRFGGEFRDRQMPALRDVPHYLHADSGYDGQFYAQLALDPMLRDPALARALDTPSFRARRILFASTAYLLGLGQPRWIIHAYAWQNLVAWLLIAALLTRWLPPISTRHFAAWVGCLFGAGLMGSVLNALLDGPSLLLVALAVLAIERRRHWIATAVLALAGLGRETNLAAAGALVDRKPHTLADAGRLVATLALIATPYLLWSAYVRSRFSSFNAGNPDSFGLPLAGYFAKWGSVLGEVRAYGWQPELLLTLGVTLGIGVQAAYLLWRREWTSAWWRVGVAYVVLLAFLSPLVWEGYPGAAVRVVAPVAVAFNILILDSRWFWPLVVLGNLSVPSGVWELLTPIATKILR